MSVFVVGHKNPDTDSVVSAIIYSKIKGGTPAVAGDLNKETQLALSKFGFEAPALIPEIEKQVTLVDHNSPEEMHPNVKKEEIVGVIDHHKLSGPFTETPLEVYMKPYGSTASIVATIASEHKYELKKEEASLLLAGVISDTLNFTSPTTTENDKKIAADLNKIAELDIDALANEMFEAKSNISGISTSELLSKDYKVFEMSGKKVGIGVWETVMPEMILERKAEILENLKKQKSEQGLDYILFASVDILNGYSDFFIEAEAERNLLESVFGGKAEDGILKAEGVVSRKKQVVPPLEKHFASK